MDSYFPRRTVKSYLQEPTKGRVDNVNFSVHSAVLGCPATGLAKETSGMAFINKDPSIVALCKLDNLVQRGDAACRKVSRDENQGTTSRAAVWVLLVHASEHKK